MTAKRPAVLRVITDVWFLAGVGFGLLAVVPKLLQNHGIEIGSQWESWSKLPGAVAYFGLIVGMFYASARYVYVAAAVGVLLNGLFYWLGGFVLRTGIKRIREHKARRSPT